MKDLMSKVEKIIDNYVKKNTAGVGLSGNDVQLTKNFKLSEFACKCGGRTSCDCGGAVKVDPELVRRLQKIRDEAGVGVNINSGFRCPNHNKRVGGSTNSQHMQGKAVDFWLTGKSVAEARKLAEKYFPDGGVGYYNTHTHVDVRGSKVRWDNR